ncbi:DUF1178 family protein [Novosphingobium ginsenosidimutans]|uniref:DUF1178 family protein n=1 Tax=Novosphingobium ginsenosidimutans TaxID=1176536 RepID=A0A5B8S8K3_9SPHN|nr:DUF1178 family protein [Novosphingobium ginsenosidimutans]QEA16775.1 DUF1178 family protein [Novosphingobium ginsenosidimutans]
MIVFDLICQPAGHRFEGWFASSEAFVEQQRRGLVDCPHCGSSSVAKAPMAPAVPRKGNQVSVPAQPAQAAQVASGLPPEALAVMEKLAKMQAEALKQSRWVGKDFAETSRAIHYGEREAEAIHGQATLEQATELLEEGVAVMPLPFPVVPPDQAN